MRPRLKYGLSPRQGPGEVRLYVPEEGSELSLEDPDGRIAALLASLDGERDEAGVYEKLSAAFPALERAEVSQAIADLDGSGLLEDAAAPTELSADELDRYASDLWFFRRYETLSVSRFAMQERLAKRRVLLLGVGGLGSTVLMNLAGLGAGTIVIVDPDVVERRNLARQFLYREADIGRSKVVVAAEAVQGINGRVRVIAEDRRIESSDDVRASLNGVDLVVMAIDGVHEALAAVNGACVSARVPFIYGGWWSWGGLYYSVDPGRSGCLACGGFDPEHVPQVRPRLPNAGIGPAATLIGGLVSLDALRYLTRFAAPVSPGKVWVTDFATGTQECRWEWPRDPACRVCGTVG